MPDLILSPSASKTCSKCGECKPSKAEYFYKRNASSDGFQMVCKVCMETQKRAKRLVDSASFHDQRKLSHSMADQGMRVCNVCHEQKAFAKFHKHPNTIGGVMARCSECVKASKALREQEKNPEIVLARIEKRSLASQGLRKCRVCCEVKVATAEFFYFDRGVAQGICKDCRKAEEKISRGLRPEYFRAKLKQWYGENKGHVAQKNREYRSKNRDSLIAASKAYYRKDPKRQIRNSLRWRAERRIDDPLFAMQERVRSFVGYAFRVNGYTKRSKTQEILGCEWSFFRLHIERQFIKGMSWENRREWHIDHIVPLASALTEDDVIALNHFTNLRPMWAKDNIAKSDKITHLL